MDAAVSSAVRVAAALTGSPGAAAPAVAPPTQQGAALVDRVCASGSLARGTRAGSDARRPIDITAFLNVDLEFGALQAPEALSQLEAYLRSSLSGDGAGGGSPSDASPAAAVVRVLDAECRGGLWAEVAFPAAATGAVAGAGGGAGTGAETASSPAVVRVFVVENKSSIVAPAASALGAGLAPQAQSLAPAAVLSQLLRRTDTESDKAAQQQAAVLHAAERRHKSAVKRAAAAGTGGGAAAAAAEDWPDRLSCGVDEARCLFWRRQPYAALHAARAMHDAWDAAVMVAATEAQQAVLWDDAVLHLLDVVTLWAALQEGGGGDEPAAAAAGQADSIAAVVRKVFATVATAPDGSRSTAPALRVCLSGGLLGGDAAVAEPTAGPAEAAGGTVVVADPCLPCMDLFGNACRVLQSPLGAQAGAGAGAQLLAAVATAGLAQLQA
ncbi:hypothetical protein CHLRE_07g326100v5 [Chlamydomonas reinhardtii]|uniref:Uncharacterized protein n=1 Tax=Chlamydomonas reinhardtii TaxID=3055 RepID=A8IHS0_CHLRE|nr:uncharacterized protein CHLRE_07g326100v5 [Chlamydomonas reinhardtii]XP_042922662.1 uncharacterized protein CHLRE_07g326100v5 [Chlamydomonas reinhardtii]PNW80695.1 hypothetical protein CHLRE_07g326100v5 [Chlamydomonas reinhardtii]PNW80696.1 hypothetical protein CHLRE_07g326100v5 [Chlamydomonas reinhardtii]|eukprot:XP_001690482.1 predicted protein [Chlamydomonas reinhardtii]